MPPLLRSLLSVICLFFIISSMDCLKTNLRPPVVNSDGGSFKIDGMWYGEIITNDGGIVANIGFEIEDDGGTLTGHEFMPIGSEGQLRPFRSLLGTIDGGMVFIDFLAPGTENSPKAKGRFMGTIENGELFGDYIILPIMFKLADGGIVTIAQYTLKCKLSRTQ